MIGTHLIARAVVIVLGLLILIFGLVDLIIPRARFVNSNPPAASIIAEPPSAVTLNFSNKLAQESTMDVTSTIRLSATGQKEYLDGSSVVTKSEINQADPGSSSLRAELKPEMHKGLYWVNWRTTAAGWRTVTYGKTYFTVGMPMPEGLADDMRGPIWEHNYQWRSKRAAIVGGAVMIALGLFMRIERRQ
jgi:methionine-rich copper-binding protein CopC